MHRSLSMRARTSFYSSDYRLGTFGAFSGSLMYANASAAGN